VIAVRIVTPVIIEPMWRRNIASGMDQPQRPFIRNILQQDRARLEKPKAHLLQRRTGDLGELFWRGFHRLTSNQMSASPCPHNIGLRV
jgi:hypothetical protein